MATPSSELSSLDAALTGSPHSELEAGAFRELDALSLKEILDQDSRPTFVLDLDPDYIVGRTLRPIFCNAALRLHDKLLDSVIGATEDSDYNLALGDNTSHEEFLTWATSTSRFNDSKDIFPLSLHYDGLLWTGSTIRSRWRIISGNALYQTSNIPKGNLLSAHRERPISERFDSSSTNPAKQFTPAETVATNVDLPSAPQPIETPSITLSKNTSKATTGSSSSVTLASPLGVVTDWTSPQPTGILSDHIMLVRQVDWASTPLGPLDSWSIQFREIVNLVMRNPHPCSLFWGEELTMIYNAPYKDEVAGNKHPELMGTGTRHYIYLTAYVLILTWNCRLFRPLFRAVGCCWARLPGMC